MRAIGIPHRSGTNGRCGETDREECMTMDMEDTAMRWNKAKSQNP